MISHEQSYLHFRKRCDLTGDCDTSAANGFPCSCTPVVPDRSCRHSGRVDTGRHNSIRYDGAKPCRQYFRPAWRVWRQCAGGPAANADHATQMWCCQSSECWWLNEQQHFGQTAISSARNRRIHLSSPRTVAVVQGLLMKACTSVLTASYVSGHGSRRIWKQQAWHRCAI